MNKYDTDVLAEYFSGFGLVRSDSAEGAKLVHIHTCCVRQKAEDKFYSLLGEMRVKKERGESFVLGVGGCVPERAPLAENYPFIDYVIGAGDPGGYRERMEGVLRGKIDEEGSDAVVACGGLTRFCTVIRGCSNYCTYCVVPYARGREKSRRPEEVAVEVEKMVAGGTGEVVLLGQNVLAYGEDLRPAKSLLDVIVLIHPLEALRRIRFVTSHPRWVKEEFLKKLGKFNKVCEHFHVPCQSGDDEILKRMNRGYTAAEYEETVALIRRYFPGAGITADVIVGFPGETEEQFQNTLGLLERVRADSVYSFKYSTRPGTAAERIEETLEPVAGEVKKERLRILNERQDAISREINESTVGNDVEVFIDEVVNSDTSRYKGRTRSNKIVDFISQKSLNPGQIIMVPVIRATPHALVGHTG